MLQFRNAQLKIMLTLISIFISLSECHRALNRSTSSCTILVLEDSMSFWPLRSRKTLETSLILSSSIKYLILNLTWPMIWCSNWTWNSTSTVLPSSSVMLPMSLLTHSWLVLLQRRPDLRLSLEIIKKSRKIRSSLLRMMNNKKWLNCRTKMQEKCICLNKKLRELSLNSYKMRRRPKQRIKRWLQALKQRLTNKSLMLMVTKLLLSRVSKPKQLTWLIELKLKPTQWSLELVSRLRSWALKPPLNSKMWRLSILLLKLNAQQSLRTWVLLMLRDSMIMKWERLMLTRSLLPTVAHRLSWVEHLVRTW